MTTIQYRKLRRIMLRVARTYRSGCAFGPADKRELKKQQRAMVNLRRAFNGASMNAGDVVTFKQPAADEVGLRFIVIEPRGNRVMVRHDDSHLSIKPTFVYPVADMRRV